MPQPSPSEIKYEYEHLQDDRGQEMVVAYVINIVLAYVAVILRLASRRISKVQLQGDDYTVVFALIIATGLLVVNLIGVHLGAGKHVILLKDPTAYAKVAIVSEVLYLVGAAIVKASVLLLYRRLFGSTRHFNLLLWCLGAFAIAYSLVGCLVVIFQCQPIRAAWDFSIPGKCVNLALGAVIVGWINVVVDFVTLCLPIRLVWQLQMRKKWKVQLIGIFLLGGFVCVGSIVRVTTLHKLSLVDATWVDVDSAIWAMVENCIGIVSACLPTLRPLFNLIARGHYCSSSQGYCTRCHTTDNSHHFGREGKFASDPSNTTDSSVAPQRGVTHASEPMSTDSEAWPIGNISRLQTSNSNDVESLHRDGAAVEMEIL